MRIPGILKSYRLWGITGLSLVMYILVVGVFGNMDISGFLPIKLATSIQAHWPDLPFFTVKKEISSDGKSQEIYYTVPTRQLTAREIAQLEANKKEKKPTSLPTPSPAAQ